MRVALGLAVLLVACGPMTAPSDGGANESDSGVDAGAVDSGVRIDAGVVDAGIVDAGTVDAGALDSGVVDAGSVDAGTIDAGTIDAGALDSGVVDAGTTIDAGTVFDAGTVDAGASRDAGTDAGLVLGELVFTRLRRPDGGSIDIGLPRTGLAASEVAVIVNTRDPQSVLVGNEYLVQHQLSASQRIEVSFDPSAAMTPALVNELKAQIDADAGFAQALAVTWTRPWQVNGMSITSALTFGFDAGFSSILVCGATAGSPIFGDTSTKPFTEHGFRPSMLVAGEDAGVAIALIARSIAAESTFPRGTGHFIRTTDNARSFARGPNFSSTAGYWNHDGGVAMEFRFATQQTNALTNTNDVLFYLTGLTSVPLQSVSFVPGALADHLTSFGGILRGSSQMSSLRWLEAGASASYGTVREPCAYQEKFPLASQLVARYLRGATAIEAYWSSVEWPDEGVFIGDPLAAPFRPKAELAAGRVRVSLPAGLPGHRYSVFVGPSRSGPWTRERSWTSSGDTLETLDISAAHSAVVIIDEGAQPEPVFARSEITDRFLVWLDGRKLLTRDTAGNLYVEELERTAPRLVAAQRRTTRPMTARADDDGMAVLFASPSGVRDAVVSLESIDRGEVRSRELPEPLLPDGGPSRTDSFIFSRAGDRIGWQNDGSGVPTISIGRIDGGVEALGSGGEVVLTDRSTLIASSRGIERVDVMSGQRTVLIPPAASRADVSAGRQIAVAERGWGTEVLARTPGEAGSIWWHAMNGLTPLSFGAQASSPSFTSRGPVWVERFDSQNWHLVRRTPSGLERLLTGVASSQLFTSDVSSNDVIVWSEGSIVKFASTRPLEPAFLEGCPDTYFSSVSDVASCHVRTHAGGVLSPTLTRGDGSAVPAGTTFVLGVPGDVTGDGVADQADVNAIMAAQGRRRGEAGYVPELDLDDDQRITLADLALRARDVLEGLPVGFATFAPPSTLGRLTLAATANRAGQSARTIMTFSFDAAPTIAAAPTRLAVVGQPFMAFVASDDPDDLLTRSATPLGLGTGEVGPLGDCDGDGASNSRDLANMRNRLGSTTGSANYRQRCDLDHDGDIDMDDIAVLGARGQETVAVLTWTPPSAGSTADFRLTAWDRRTPVIARVITLRAQ